MEITWYPVRIGDRQIQIQELASFQSEFGHKTKEVDLNSELECQEDAFTEALFQRNQTLIMHSGKLNAIPPWKTKVNMLNMMLWFKYLRS